MADCCRSPGFVQYGSAASPQEEETDAQEFEFALEDELMAENKQQGIQFISPFASAASKSPVVVPQISVLPSNSKFGNNRPLAPSAHAYSNKSPKLGGPAYSQRRNSHMPPTAFSRTSGIIEPDGRRKSVDTAALNSPAIKRGNKRMRTDVDGEQDTAERQESNSLPGGRESMFADYLSAILNHSLSLCAGRGETSLDLFARGDNVLPMLSPKSGPINPASPALPEIGSPQTSISSSTPATQFIQQFRVKRQPSQGELTAGRRSRLLSLLQSWSFDGLALEADEIYECACLMFEGVLAMEGVDVGVEMQSSLTGLLTSLRNAYHARNGYHNFTHAVDVLQAIYSFLVALGAAPPLSYIETSTAKSTRWRRSAAVEAAGGIGPVLRPMDVFSLMIAAIGHDVGHPGLSNAYMVNAKTPVAQVYGDVSVLENFHLVTLIQMLRKHGLGHLFGHADRGPSSSDSDCRKVLFASVLATDMSRHFPFVAKLQELSRRSDERPRFDSEIDDDRLLLCSGLMKCADISNPTRPHHVAKQWSTALLEEWSVQAKIEADFKLPVSVVILNPAEAKAQAKSQVGFINLFTQPLFDALTGCLPEFKQFSNHCRDGRRHWEAIVLADEHFPLSDNSETPRPLGVTKLSASALAARELSDGAARRRRPPPAPLVFSRSFKTRTSVDSTASSALSPLSPLFSPDARRQASSFSSAYSVATTASSRSVYRNRTQCTGVCGLVTEKCPSCLADEQECNPTRMPSDETIVPVSAASTPGEERELCELWPPVAFWPSFATAEAQ